MPHTCIDTSDTHILTQPEILMINAAIDDKRITVANDENNSKLYRIELPSGEYRYFSLFEQDFVNLASDYDFQSPDDLWMLENVLDVAYKQFD